MNINNAKPNKLSPSVFLNANNQDELNIQYELLKIIKRFEYCSGWTLLIAPDHLPKKDILNSYDVNLDKVLIVHKKHCTDILFTAYQGLRNQNCSALVIWDGLISNSEYALLNAKAKAVNSALYLINKNTHDLAIVHH
jgi:cell division inhibitor SulA